MVLAGRVSVHDGRVNALARIRGSVAGRPRHRSAPREREGRLNDGAVKAWKEFDGLDAWGDFTLAPMDRMLKQACAMADVTVYDMRHSYGTALARKRIRLDVIGALMGHSSLELTKRYTLAAVMPEAAEATKRLAAAARR